MPLLSVKVTCDVQVLAISRIMVAWQPVGIAAGVYDMCVRYTTQRQQFSKPLAAFQIQQERLARMAGSIQVCAALHKGFVF